MTTRDERAKYQYTTIYTSSARLMQDKDDGMMAATVRARAFPYPKEEARDDERPDDPTTVSQDPKEAVVVQIVYTGIWCILSEVGRHD